MTNFEKWRSEKDFNAMQEEFQELRSWGDCHCCPASDDCNGGNLCRDPLALKVWANKESK